MPLTLNELERRAYIENNQPVLQGIAAAEADARAECAADISNAYRQGSENGHDAGLRLAIQLTENAVGRLKALL